MATTTQDIANNIIAQAQALDPAVSFDVGTPERLIVEAVADNVAQAIVDFQVLNSQNDIDTMTGSRLDNYLSLFSFGRQQPTLASGFITLSRTTPSLDDIPVPVGTQVVARPVSLGLAPLTYVTTKTAVLPAGNTTVDIPIQATLPGSTSNLPAGTINSFGTQPVPGISTISNNAATTGGEDGETDDQLRVRFKNTAFRNVSGTVDQYLALAVSSPVTTKANVVGALSRHQEYVQVPMSDDTNQNRPIVDPQALIYPHKRTTAPSVIPYSKFTYDTQFYLNNGSFGSDAVFYKPDIDFVFNNPVWLDGDAIGTVSAFTDHQPNITILFGDVGGQPFNGSGIVPGDVLLLEHAYLSKNSRNDYLNGILNCVDIFVNGESSAIVSSSEGMPGSAYTFVSAPDTAISFIKNYKRRIDGSHPSTGNRLHVPVWQPLIDVPDTIQIGTNVYYKARYVQYDETGTPTGYFYDADFTQQANYWTVYENTELYGTVRARNGIEWSSTAVGVPLPSSNSAPVVATSWAGRGQFTLTNYTYDQNVANLQAIMEQNRQATTDVLVHKARIRYFKLYITVMYSSGVTTSVVNQDIAGALNTFFTQQYFGSVVQMSDLLQVIHNTPGVDNVRWSSDVDNTLHKVVEVQQNGTTALDDNGNPLVYDGDFFLQDSELPSLPDTSSGIATALVIKTRAQNVWGRL